MSKLSRGQLLALLQLKDIEDNSDGALEILEQPIELNASSQILIRLSLETKGYRTIHGLAFRDRERFDLFIHRDFPFKKPIIYFAHKRFIGTPHVQWGSAICLYQSSETEYNPSDGMFGFLTELSNGCARLVKVN